MSFDQSRSRPRQSETQHARVSSPEIPRRTRTAVSTGEVEHARAGSTSSEARVPDRLRAGRRHRDHDAAVHRWDHAADDVGAIAPAHGRPPARSAARQPAATQRAPHFGQTYVFMLPIDCSTVPWAAHFGHRSVGRVGAGTWTGMREL